MFACFTQTSFSNLVFFLDQFTRLREPVHEAFDTQYGRGLVGRGGDQPREIAWLQRTLVAFRTAHQDASENAAKSVELSM
jgi:hypothetical protein